MDCRTRWKHYELESYYKGDKESPLGDGNKNVSLLMVRNAQTSNFAHFVIWGSKDDPKFETPKRLVFGFFNLLQSALYGTLSPEEYCNALGLPKVEDISRPLWKQSQHDYAAVAQILTEPLVDILKEMKTHGIKII